MSNDEGSLQSQLRNTLLTSTLFDPTTLVLLRGQLNKGKGKILEDFLVKHLKEVPASTFLVIEEQKIDARKGWYKLLQALEKEGRAKIEEYKIPEGHALTTWIKETLAELGGHMSSAALTRLAARFTVSPSSSRIPSNPDYSLWQIRHELEKCIAYAKGRDITPEDIDLLVPLEPTAHAFDFLDAILARDTKKSLVIAHHLVSAKDDFFPLMGMLHGQLRDLIALKDLSDARESDTHIATSLGWKNPRRVWVVKNKITQHTLKDLCFIAQQFITFDTSLRGGEDNPITSFDRLIIEVTKNPA